LGRRFYDEITRVFRRVVEHPLRYKQFDPPARRLFANGFPYAVIYVALSDAIWIIAEFHSEQHRQQIRRRGQRVDAVGFFNLLTGPELLEVTEAHLPEHRERLYPRRQ
jgi:plasmid stabilization system protein ParE